MLSPRFVLTFVTRDIGMCKTYSPHSLVRHRAYVDVRPCTCATHSLVRVASIQTLDTSIEYTTVA